MHIQQRAKLGVGFFAPISILRNAVLTAIAVFTLWAGQSYLLGGREADLDARVTKAVLSGIALSTPTDVDARAIDANRIDVRWTDTSDGESSFGLIYAADAEFTDGVRRVLQDGITLFVHSGLQPATTYWYRIKANGANRSPWSVADATTTPPSDFVATINSATAVDLVWIGNADNPNIVGYTVQYADNVALTGARYRFVGPGSAASFRLEGLTIDRTYYFRIKAEGTSDTLDSPYSAVTYTTVAAQSVIGPEIPENFFGINAWLPKTIAGVERGGKFEKKLCGDAYVSGAACIPAEVAASGVRMLRYGGIAVDKNYSVGASPREYLQMVDNLRANGIEPLLQVPFYRGAYSASQAADLVRYLNFDMDRGVKYWTIGNEPNWGDYRWNASQIAGYFKEFARSMKEVDPTIRIVGPDLAFYDSAIMTELMTPDGIHDITGAFVGIDGARHNYLDIVDFHTYPFDGDLRTQTRQAVIDQPVGRFQETLVALKANIDRANREHGRSGENALRMAVTEINVDWRNPSYGNADQIRAGVGAPSFLAGQYWADAMSVGMKNGLAFMTFWSVIEGNGLGYIASDGTRMPTYFHFQMVARNFQGRYLPGISRVNGAADRNVKVFGSKSEDNVVVMILNQSFETLNYSVRLNNRVTNSTNTLDVNLDAGLDREYRSPEGEPMPGQSTLLLIFDANGVLRQRQRYAIEDAEPLVFNY